MRPFWLLMVGLLPAGAGCATLSLENYTLREVRTVKDFRIEATLDCLAMTAASPDNLPAFGLTINGTAKIQDMETANSTTLWTRLINGFATESLALSVSRQPQGSWSLEPIGDYSKLAAVRCACRWAISGPDAAIRECGNLLEDPAVDYSPQEPRFGVAERLRRLRPGWVHRGCLADVPQCVKYKGHCNRTWVWVMPEDESCLADFILVLHDIATIDISAIYSPPLLVTITRNFRTMIEAPTKQAAPPAVDPNKLNPLVPQIPTKENGTTIEIKEYRVVRPEKRAEVEASIQTAMREGKKVVMPLQQWLDCTYAYSGTRTNTKAAGGLQPPGGNGAALQQQNLVPPTRNPGLYPQYLGGSVPTPEELARVRALLGPPVVAPPK